MKEIELNPDGTFPWQNKHVTYTTVTATYTTAPKDFIPDPPKKKDWKKELKGTLVYIWIMTALGLGSVMLIVEIIKGIIWLIKHL